MRALAFAHFHERGERLIHGLLHRRPNIFRAGQLLVGLEHAGRAQHLVQRHVAGKFQLLRQPRELGGVVFGERGVNVFAHGQLALGGMERDAHVHAPARDVAVDDIAELGFEHFQFAWQRHRHLGLLAVHGT